MFINIIFTGKLCNELFTSPVLFTGEAISAMFNHFHSLEETRYWTFKTFGIFPMLN